MIITYFELLLPHDSTCKRIPHIILHKLDKKTLFACKASCFCLIFCFSLFTGDGSMGLGHIEPEC